MEHVTVNRKDEGRRFLQAGRAQVTAGINNKYKDTHQRIIQEEEKINKAADRYEMFLIINSRIEDRRFGLSNGLSQMKWKQSINI